MDYEAGGGGGGGGGGTVTNVTGTAPISSTGGTTPDISIPKATTTVDGYLAATDFVTFNNKQPAGNYVTSLTGDITGSGPGATATTIANDAVTTLKVLNNAITNAKLAQMATQTFKGRTTAGTGDPEDLTATQATAILNNFVGDSGSGGTKGLVPAPAALDATKNKVVKADGNWSAYFPENTSAEAVRAVSTWTEQTHPSANQWFDICYAPDLRRLVAIASSGTNRVMYSDDGGVTWTDASAANNVTWTAVAYSPELKLFVAVAFDGTTSTNNMYSTDGITWTASTSAAANQWYSLEWAPAIGLFCATSLNGTNRVMTSPDGINWTPQSASATAQWYALAWSDDLNLFAAVALGGSIMTSPDGATWTNRTSPAANDWHEIVWSKDLGIFCAVALTGASRTMTSSDGITWTTSGSIAAASWRTIAYSEELGIFVALASGGQIASSPNGTTWTSRTSPSANQFYGLTWCKDFRVFVGTSITGTNRVIRSRYVGGFQSSGLQGPTGATGATGATGPTGPASATGELVSDSITQTTQQTTTSATFSDISGLSFTLTSSIACKILASFSGVAKCTATTATGEFRIVIDAQNGTSHILNFINTTETQGFALEFLSTSLAAGTYTVKVQFRETSGLGTLALNQGVLVGQVQQGAGPYSMSQAIEIREDWVATGIAGSNAWTNTVSGTGAASTLVTTNQTSNNAGIIQHSTGTTATGRAAHSLGVTLAFFSGGIATYESLIYIPTLASVAEDYRIRLGFGDDVVGNDQVDGVYFEYDRGVSANWRCKTSNNSTRTTTDSGTAVAAGAWVKLGWVMNAAGNSVAFYINGTNVATNTTNIPTAVARVCGPFHIISKIAGTTARTFLIDYMFYRQVFTTPR
ncbi:MAG TPA: hypothetical protein PK473_03020 [Nitrosomonas sp.]|nr:hypothetical protein [Agitococcus sp.]HNA69982.1 hypothetical protein [Nitrosomonas sp.]